MNTRMHPVSMDPVKHWIDGRQVDSAERFITTNPATGEAIAEVASGGEAEINAAVAAAKAAFPAWANTPAKQRAKLMRRLGELIEQNVPHLAALETMDTGLPIAQTSKQLIPRASENFHFFAEVCTQINGRTYPVDDQMLNYTLYQPVGVCALISPWNVPFMTATWKVAPCLALGNTAVLKMSELSPLTADQLGRLALEAGIPPGVVNVVSGFGDEAGAALANVPFVPVNVADESQIGDLASRLPQLSVPCVLIIGPHGTVVSQIDGYVDQLTSSMPYIKSGKVRGLAVSSATRSPAFPELPTIAEAGVPGYEATTWTGIVAPAGVPKAIVTRLNHEINTALQTASLREKLLAIGSEPMTTTPEQFAALIRSENAKWAEVIKRSGAKVD